MVFMGSLGHGEFDFADDMAVVSREQNVSGDKAVGTYPEDGTGGFIKFEGEGNLYNIYDAGNFLTGKAFGMIGVTKAELLSGADMNSRLTLHGPDTPADQQALSRGYDYKGVTWKSAKR
jgi:hypothetical protein